MERVNISRANRLVLSVNLLVDFFLIAGYIVEVIKGLRSVILVTPFLMFIIISAAVMLVVYRKDDNSEYIKHISAISFLIIYLYAMFTSTRILTHLYIYPAMITYMLYLDMKFIKRVCFSGGIVNVIYVIYMISVKHHFSASLSTDYTIQLLVLIAIIAALILGTKVIIKNNEEQLASINEGALKQENMLKDILRVGNVLDKNCDGVFSCINNIEQGGQTLKGAIDHIAEAMGQTVESVEKQKSLTEEIQGAIEQASCETVEMDKASEQTMDLLKDVKQVMDNLSSKTLIFTENSDTVYKAMLEVEEETKKIQNIIASITSIAAQTNILSLNASIESARAGEAGKGFAVVANEVRNLSSQTNESAANITTIIDILLQSVEKCVKAMDEFRVISNEQTEIINHTQSIFNKTNEGISKLKHNADQVSHKVNYILESNTNIVARIDEISALSQEAMAGVEETSSVIESNAVNIANTKASAQKMMDTSNEMKKYL